MITKQSQRDVFEKAIDDVLLLCADSSFKPSKLMPLADKSVTPSTFGECETFIGLDFNDNEAVDISRDGILYPGPGMVTLRDLPTRWQVSSITYIPNDDDSDWFTLRKTQTVSLKAVRGLGKLITPFVVESSQCIVNKTTGACAGKRYFFNWTGSKWIHMGGMSPHIYFWQKAIGVEAGIGTGFEDPDYEDRSIKAAMGIAFCRDLNWYVSIKSLNEGFSLMFPTDSHGAAAAFKDRDKGESGRRDALRHWVKEHYRKKDSRSDGIASDVVHVCSHLRGRVPFKWRGLDCELIAAPFDVRRAESMKARKAEIMSK